MKPERRKDLLTTKQVATKLNIHPKLVLRYVRNLSLPCYRFGKEFRYDADEVEAWIEQHRHQNTFCANWRSRQRRKRDKE